MLQHQTTRVDTRHQQQWSQDNTGGDSGGGGDSDGGGGGGGGGSGDGGSTPPMNHPSSPAHPLTSNSFEGLTEVTLSSKWTTMLELRGVAS